MNIVMKWTGNIMNKRKLIKNIYFKMIIFLILFLFIIYLFGNVYENHKSTVVKQQTDQLGIIANVGTSYLSTYVKEKNLEIQNMFTFRELGDDPKHVKEVVKGTIKLYWNQSPLYLDYMKYFTLDELNHIKIAGLSKDYLYSYKQQALKSNELIIGPLVQVNHNNMGIYLFKGIFNEHGKYGLLIGRINLGMVFHSTISNIKIGDSGFLTLSDIDENFSYLGNQKGLYFSSKLPDFFNNEDYLKGYSFTKVGDLNLLISARLPFREMEKPIQITFYLLLSLSFGLFILFGIFMYVLLQSQKKELAYSIELKLQKQMHERNRNEVLGLFSRKIAHDYNNLLTPIFIYCELLEDSITDESLLEYVHEIQQSSKECTLLAKEFSVGSFYAIKIAGGVHGGNRIGGTAVTDIVVYGRVAGTSAANYVSNMK